MDDLRISGMRDTVEALQLHDQSYSGLQGNIDVQAQTADGNIAQNGAPVFQGRRNDKTNYR